jgi:hypothetical protein
VTHEEALSVLGAFALHALDPDDEGVVWAHVDACGFCRGELYRYEQVVALLGLIVPDA